MRFSDKIFFATTAVLTVSFTIFGMWILSSYFQKILNREMEQGNTESQMFQYVFEMAYSASPKEYGDDYFLSQVMNSVMENLTKEGNTYYIFSEDGRILYGENMESPSSIEEGYSSEEVIFREFQEISSGLEAKNMYGYKVVLVESAYYLLSICRSEREDLVLFLATRKDITAIYEDRQVLLNQYRIVLGLLLAVGAGGIFFLSRYMTEPIRNLTATARRIAAGDYKIRSGNDSMDEVGELSQSFDMMADNLVDRMKEKELEARQKEDFTAAFAHELKTPLTSIIGYADMLSTMELSDAERSEAAYYIFTQGKRLESLSHKLLELVSVDKQEFLGTIISTKKLEENIKITMRPILEQRGINGKIYLERSKIYGDRDLLLSLLYNLLDNAVKAVEEGGFILLKGSKCREGYEFKVVDNGRGIPNEEISRITEAFYMVDKSRARKEGGVGIGMALCQKIVHLHNGSLQIVSKLGEGTVIKILLPGKEQDI